VGNSTAPFAEQTIVHGGKQSMPLDYNNLGAPFCSEAEQVWATPEDWSAPSLSTLTLHFRGTSANKADRLYEAITDKSGKVGTLCPTSSRIAMSAWTRWQIPLSDFTAAGVNLAAVKKMVIGLGDRDSAKAGGVGVLYLDDIYVGGLGVALAEVALFAEDFEGLKLGPKVDEGLAGTNVWTKATPPGWVHDDKGVPGVGTPNDGVTEWAAGLYQPALWWRRRAIRPPQFTKRGRDTMPTTMVDDASHPVGRQPGITTFLAPVHRHLHTARHLTLKFDPPGSRVL
jgi:hypothetical protein